MEVDQKQKYQLSNLKQELQHAYSDEEVDFSLDDENRQSNVICRTCYRNLIKVRDKKKHLKHLNFHTIKTIISTSFCLQAQAKITYQS